VAINRQKVLDAAQKYIEKNKYDKAVIELRALVAAEPNDARTLQKIGDLQLKQGLVAEALDTYDSVGNLYARDGFATKAVAVYKNVREILADAARRAPPGQPGPLSHLEARYGHVAAKLADLYRELGLTSDALALLNEIATSLQRQQKHVEAIDVFRQIAALDPNNPIPHLHVAEALSRERDVEGAVAEFANAAALLVKAERNNDALQVLERLLHHRADPGQARLCAELYLARNRPPHDAMQALAKLQICYRANPHDVEVLRLIARGFELVGQHEKAADLHREIARISAMAKPTT